MFTRWYRPPEAFDTPCNDGVAYNNRADVFAVAATAIELLTGQVLFQGENDADQLCRIGNFQGRAKFRLLQMMGCASESCPTIPIRDALVDLLTRMLKWHASDRPSAAEALDDDFWK